MEALLIAVALQVGGGLGAICFSRSPRWATSLGVGGAVAGSLLGLVPTFQVLLGGAATGVHIPWDFSHGDFSVEIDALSAFFLLPVLGLSALAAIYGGEYLFAYRHEKALGSPWFFFNVFVASMVMVVIARTAVLFLMAWEVMSVAAYCLVTFEHEKAEVRRAGWIYLIATHLGVAFLLAVFVLLGRPSGSLEFEAYRAVPALGSDWTGLIFVLALVGFGAKAGFVPLHVWLPEAHPAAPSYVSALMSGVMIKMGLYGLLRTMTFLGPPAPWWGPALVVIGLSTGLIGVSLALYQRDLKRVLAYSSIENMGLIALALGMGLWGMSTHQPTVAVLGVTGALLHVWNHALMKGLMFFAAGSVLHGTGSRDMERLGGLMKRMPWTGGAMLLGGVGMAALPPSNGFVSEWLIYLGLMKSGLATADSRGLVAFLAVGALAFIGGLGVLTFVRLTGITLLGSPRSEPASHAHESSPWLLGPMVILLFLCLGVALAPQLVVRLLSGVLDQIVGQGPGQALGNLESSDVPLAIVGNLNAWTFLAVGSVMMAFLAWSRKKGQAEGPTWACGYAKPSARMQYTGRSFAEMMAEHLLLRFLRPQMKRQAPIGLFPAPEEFASECPDPFSRKVYEPFFRHWADRFSQLRILQQGKVHIYLAYIVLMVVLTLAWVSLRTWWKTP